MPRMTASRGVEVTADPRLEKVPGFGRSIAQPPIQLPVIEHNGHRADTHSIYRSKNKVLRRRYAQQLINAGKGTNELVEMATKPGRRS